jgi:glycosyltransferase involved in cell wall biosynthesis
MVFNPESPLAMAESINIFLSDSKLQKDCRDKLKKVRTELNWEREDEKLLSLYSDY